MSRRSEATQKHLHVSSRQSKSYLIELLKWSNFSRDEITNCLAEMMNPRYRFEELTRAERVACIKGLRVTIEDRRGELLMKEIERRINEQSSNGEDYGA